MKLHSNTPNNTDCIELTTVESRNVSNSIRIRPRGQHLLPRGPPLSGGVCHRGHQAGLHRPRHPHGPGRGASCREARDVSADGAQLSGEDNAAGRTRGLRLLRPHGRRADAGRQGAHRVTEPLVRVQRADKGENVLLSEYTYSVGRWRVSPKQSPTWRSSSQRTTRMMTKCP